MLRNQEVNTAMIEAQKLPVYRAIVKETTALIPCPGCHNSGTVKTHAEGLGYTFIRSIEYINQMVLSKK